MIVTETTAPIPRTFAFHDVSEREVLALYEELGRTVHGGPLQRFYAQLGAAVRGLVLVAR